MAARKIEIGWTGETVRNNLVRYRAVRRMTLADMVDKLAELGRDISVPTLSAIENAKRRIDVDDLTFFALALDVSPAALMMPAVEHLDDKLADVPGYPDHPAAEAVDWWNWLVAQDPLWEGPTTSQFEVDRWRWDSTPPFARQGRLAPRV